MPSPRRFLWVTLLLLGAAATLLWSDGQRYAVLRAQEGEAAKPEYQELPDDFWQAILKLEDSDAVKRGKLWRDPVIATKLKELEEEGVDVTLSWQAEDIEQVIDGLSLVVDPNLDPEYPWKVCATRYTDGGSSSTSYTVSGERLQQLRELRSNLSVGMGRLQYDYDAISPFSREQQSIVFDGSLEDYITSICTKHGHGFLLSGADHIPLNISASNVSPWQVISRVCAGSKSRVCFHDESLQQGSNHSDYPVDFKNWGPRGRLDLEDLDMGLDVEGAIVEINTMADDFRRTKANAFRDITIFIGPKSDK